MKKKPFRRNPLPRDMKLHLKEKVIQNGFIEKDDSIFYIRRCCEKRTNNNCQLIKGDRFSIYDYLERASDSGICFISIQIQFSNQFIAYDKWTDTLAMSIAGDLLIKDKTIFIGQRDIKELFEENKFVRLELELYELV